MQRENEQQQYNVEQFVSQYRIIKTKTPDVFDDEQTKEALKYLIYED